MEDAVYPVEPTVITDQDGPGVWLPRLKAAKRLGISDSTIDRRIKTGQVRSRRRLNGSIEVFVPDSIRDVTDEEPEDDDATVSTQALIERLTYTQSQGMKQFEEIIQRTQAETAERIIAALKAEGIIQSSQVIERLGTIERKLDLPWWRKLLR